MNDPSGEIMNAAVDGSSPGSVGTATKRLTCTRKCSPSRSGLRGVITSSSPSRRNAAAEPSTDTLPTDAPAKSRLKRESDCVARARIVAVPSIDCDGALVA